MKNTVYYDLFLDAISKKFPHKSQLVKELVKLLRIEREAVYRRLRKVVSFTMEEVVKISLNWNVSIDNIIFCTPRHIHPIQLNLLRYVNPSETDLHEMENFISALESVKNHPESEYMEVSNLIPGALFSGFQHLARYYTFQWLYRYGGNQTPCPLSLVIQSDKIRQMELAHFNGIANIANVQYICDSQLLESLVRDIKYFESIYLIMPEETQLIKKDIAAWLNFMEEILIKGCFPNTKNQVLNFFISNTDIDTGYAYFSSANKKISMIRTFIMNVAATEDAELCENIKTWIQLKKRASVQISGVNEKWRIDFLNKQRKLIESL
jgi:hypothetical protein